MKFNFQMKKLRECIVMWEEGVDTGKWHVLAFDGVLQENHAGECTVTGYPIDSGFIVSDHTIRHNRTIELQTITSNISMSVATQRKTFEETYKEILLAVGAVDSGYKGLNKHGRAKYDNDSTTFASYLQFGEGDDVTSGFTTDNSLVNALTAQISLVKVDETLDIINKLNESGQLVHVATLRGLRKNCVLKSYSASNNVTNSYSLPCTILFEQLNVIDMKKAKIATPTEDTQATEVQQEMSSVREVNTTRETFSTRTRATARQKVDLASIFIPNNFSELEHKEVPFSTKYDTSFVYKGVDYTMAKVRYNPTMDCYITDLQWRVTNGYRTLRSIPLQSGTNLVRNLGTNMPSHVAINTADRNTDPTTTKALKLFIVENFDEVFLGA